jgi:hypothetical protein
MVAGPSPPRASEGGCAFAIVAAPADGFGQGVMRAMRERLAVGDRAKLVMPSREET